MGAALGVVGGAGVELHLVGPCRQLEELRVEHQTNEASADSIISCLQDKLIQVRPRPAISSLDQFVVLSISIINIVSNIARYLSHTNQSK